jgi:protein-L-isoaspartate(D-aspartate) O-methyltransferase
MLEQLAVRDHHRVLEIGTGTGWTAALLSWRLGAGNVTTVEIDPELAGQARKNLQAAGLQPEVVTGDGADGHPARAPYDRVHATCAVEQVPWPWIAQTRPGGVILTPYTNGYGFGHLARLTVTTHDSAVGRFPLPAGFMMLRAQRHLRGDPAGFLHHENQAGIFSTQLDPRTLAAESSPGADLAIGELVPGCQFRVVESADHAGPATFYLFETRTREGSWANAEFRPGRQRFAVSQYGPRRLWDEVEEAYSWWLEAGCPGRERFGMTVTADDQWVWHDHPGNRVSSRLTSGNRRALQGARPQHCNERSITGMTQAKPATRVCGACNKTRLSGYNPGTVCAPCERALLAARELSDPDRWPGLAGWVWDTEPMRRALARLDFPAVLVIYRSAARLPRRELGEITGLSHSVIWYYKAGTRQGIYDIRQLLHFAGSVQMPREALLPVILGQPCGLGDLLADSVTAAPQMAGAGVRS